jgi:hypothetical protein
MKKKNEMTRKNITNVFNNLTADFCWVFLPNGDLVQMHEDSQYSQYLNDSYESKSNQPL